jgi:hypothetical protein
MKTSNFSFGDKFFLQKTGLAMASKLSSSVAILVMAYYEKKNFEDGFIAFNTSCLRNNWWRYLDDIFII